jgi:iron complex outermembrane receptor protein
MVCPVIFVYRTVDLSDRQFGFRSPCEILKIRASSTAPAQRSSPTDRLLRGSFWGAWGENVIGVRMKDMSRPRQLASLALAFAAGVAAPTATSAQTDTIRADTTIYRIQGIEIESQRPVMTIGGASPLEIEVGSLGLPAAPTGAEVLAAIHGVHVRTNSRGQAEISVRGSESRQVAVLLDGVPLTLGYDARTDVSILPAGALREVTFVRGLSTLLHGPNVLGGVVEMNVARSPVFPENRSAEFAASADHLGGYSTSANTTIPFTADAGQGLVRAGIGFRDSPGVPLPNGVTEPVPADDDLRLNTDFTNLDGFLAFRYAADGGAWAGLSATSHRADRGIAAELGAAQPRLWRYPDIRRTVVALSAGTGDRATALGRGDVEASVGYDVGGTDVRSYTTRAYEVVDGFENGDDRTLTLRLLADHTLGSRGELRSSLTYANIDHDETIDDEFRAFEQRLVSAAAETVWRLVDDPGAGLSSMRLSFGGAYDHGTTPLTGGLESLPAIGDWGARVGLSALVNDGATMLHAGASRRGRFPALREVYSEALDRFQPNPDLRPEHLVAIEAGVTSRVESGEFQVMAFRHDLSGAIRRIALPNGLYQRINSDELTSTGVELLLTQQIGRVSFGGELTLQSVELTDPMSSINTRPENLPEQLGSAFLEVPLGAGLASSLDTEYTGAQYCIDPDSGQDVRLDGGSLFNATLSKVWSLVGGSAGSGRRIETSVSGLNLSDTALYDACGLPRPGRLLRFQVRVF